MIDKEGQYERTEKNEDERKYYQFLKPVNEDFPYQLELFSRVHCQLRLNKLIVILHK